MCGRRCTVTLGRPPRTNERDERGGRPPPRPARACAGRGATLDVELRTARLCKRRDGLTEDIDGGYTEGPCPLLFLLLLLPKKPEQIAPPAPI